MLCSVLVGMQRCLREGMPAMIRATCTRLACWLAAPGQHPLHAHRSHAHLQAVLLLLRVPACLLLTFPYPNMHPVQPRTPAGRARAPGSAPRAAPPAGTPAPAAAPQAPSPPRPAATEEHGQRRSIRVVEPCLLTTQTRCDAREQEKQQGVHCGVLRHRPQPTPAPATPQPCPHLQRARGAVLPQQRQRDLQHGAGAGRVAVLPHQVLGISGCGCGWVWGWGGCPP